MPPHRRPSLMFLMPALTIGVSSAWVVSASGDPPSMPPVMGDPIDGLTQGQLDRWAKGRIAFNRNLSVEEGLGPIFNQTSCGSCHNNPVGGTGVQNVTRFGAMDKKGGFDPLEAFGGSLLQAQSISDHCAEFVPDFADVTSLRMTTSTLGAGLIESISDSDLLSNRDLQDGTVRGDAHMVVPLETPGGSERVGRFGWKAQVATVLTFSGDAGLNELGLTNRLLVADNAPNGDEERLAECDSVADPEDVADSEGFEFIDRVTDFQRYLAPPPQTPSSGMAGETIFVSIGCSACHTPAFTTPNDGSIEDVLADRQVRAYSDFLLHDMGLGGDGIAQGAASGRQIRTTPLWGLRARSTMWHDGRFKGEHLDDLVRDSIEAHGLFGSQGIDSAEAFASLSSSDQDALISFLDSLGQAPFDADGDLAIDLADFYDNGETKPGLFPCYGATVTPDDPCAIHDIDADGIVSDDDVTVFLGAYDDPAADCDADGVHDLSEILSGEADDDLDGIPDVCEPCDADADGNGSVDTGDILLILSSWGDCPAPCPADVDGSGAADVGDILAVIAAWGDCP